MAVIGAFGSGKSLFMMECGLRMANAYRKKIITNFKFNESAIREYCKAYKLDWFAKFGRLVYLNFDTVPLEDIWNYKQSVILIDELGNWASSRDWAKMSSYFRNNINQVRRHDIHLMCGYQFFSQVDVHIRELIQHFSVCSSVGSYDVELRAPKITARYVTHYLPEQYLALQRNVEAQTKMIAPWRKSTKREMNSLIFNKFICECKNFSIVLGSILSPKKYATAHEKQFKSKEELLFKCFDTKELIGVARPTLGKLYQFPGSDELSKGLAHQRKNKS